MQAQETSAAIIKPGKLVAQETLAVKHNHKAVVR
jgi:hypothetical protein